MIVVVAPYSPAGCGGVPHLGAARKIEIVVAVLSALDPDIVLVNSAHNESGWYSGRLTPCMIGETPVTEIRPRRWPARRLGKFLNLLEVRQILRRLKKRGRPSLVWLYNGYVFESLFGFHAKKKWNCPVFVEFEDAHFARNRGLKQRLDQWAWSRTAHSVDHGFGVNRQIVKELRSAGVNAELLPGVVPQAACVLGRIRPAFTGGTGALRVGYFGGLTHEKGAGVVLAAMAALGDSVHWTITGAGELASEFHRYERLMPRSFRYQECVPAEDLYALVADCDVLLNPHRSIREMGDGVFPFKVIEAIAMGRLLISTPLPDLGVDGLMDGVVTYGGEADELVAQIQRAPESHALLAGAIYRAQQLATELFSDAALARKIGSAMAGLRASETQDSCR